MFGVHQISYWQPILFVTLISHNFILKVGAVHFLHKGLEKVWFWPTYLCEREKIKPFTMVYKGRGDK